MSYAQVLAPSRYQGVKFDGAQRWKGRGVVGGCVCSELCPPPGVRSKSYPTWGRLSLRGGGWLRPHAAASW